MRILLSLVLIVCLSINPYAQELKLKRKRKGSVIEEYQVLKSNKSIMQGFYIKFLESPFMGPPIIKEVGLYDSGQKTGNWYFINNLGDLYSEGMYQNGSMQGLWFTYYTDSSANLVSAFSRNNLKSFELSPNGIIKVNRELLQVSSKGVYENDVKIGAWNYYSRDGELIHKFDHTRKFMIYPDTLVNTTLYWGRPHLENILTFHLYINTFKFKDKKPGKMLVHFDVSKQGTIQNVTFSNSIDRDVDKGLLAGLLETSGFWFPSERVQSFVLPFEFSNGEDMIDSEESVDFDDAILLDTFSIDLGLKEN